MKQKWNYIRFRNTNPIDKIGCLISDDYVMVSCFSTIHFFAQEARMGLVTIQHVSSCNYSWLHHIFLRWPSGIFRCVMILMISSIPTSLFLFLSLSLSLSLHIYIFLYRWQNYTFVHIIENLNSLQGRLAWKLSIPCVHLTKSVM